MDSKLILFNILFFCGALLQCKALLISRSSGPGSNHASCPLPFRPVCGLDGVTYPNYLCRPLYRPVAHGGPCGNLNYNVESNFYRFITTTPPATKLDSAHIKIPHEKSGRCG